MLRFIDFINENYKNITTKQDKQKYKDQVWDILTKSYQYIGGIKGSGFESSHVMVDRIPYWKIFTRDGKVIAVMLYKDKNGRKMVACGSDGSAEGKQIVKRMIEDDIRHQRAYGEISDALVAYVNRHFTKDEISKYFVPADQVSKILNKPVKPIDKYTYTRLIGGEQHEKMMYGKPHQQFKQ